MITPYMNLHDFVAYDKKTNAKTHSSLFFINVESDGGSASIETTLKNIEENYHVCPFTGLKDKNGTKIYEGDVLSHPYDRTVMEWSEDIACFRAKVIGGGSDRFWQKMDEEKLEVIGNRYHNPELL